MEMHAMSFKKVVVAKSAVGICGNPQRCLWMAAALLLPLLLGVRRPAVASLVWQGLAAVFGIAGCAVVWAAARQGRWVGFADSPPGQVTGLVDPGHRKRVPLVTLVFVAAIVILTLALPHAATDRLCGLRLDDPGLGGLIRVTAARTLLHDTYGRLAVDALLLGLLGLYLEPRLGALRTLTLFFMGSFVAGLIGLNFLLPQVAVPGGGMVLLPYPPAGGTGAVAALLGVGSLGWNPGRDAGKTLVEKGPRCCGIMDILWPLLTTLVFWGPFSGHTMPITGPGGMAGYGGQVGGFLSGLAMALILRTMGENDIDRGTPSAASYVLATVVAARPDNELHRLESYAADWRWSPWNLCQGKAFLCRGLQKTADLAPSTALLSSVPRARIGDRTERGVTPLCSR